MRRKRGAIIPLEEAILAVGVGLRRSAAPEFHGFKLAKQLQAFNDGGRLIAHGTLYKGLSRMEQAGLLASRWEDAQIATDEGRPLRRLYHVTGLVESALASLHAERGSARRLAEGGMATP